MIPFNRPPLLGGELAQVETALGSGHLAGDGPFSKRCHSFFETTFGVKKALLTSSCTDALEMCALLLELEPGDEVIVPSFTFVSTANAFALHGAKIVFADVRPDTLNLDERQLPELVTSRTRAIVAVHYAGVGCDMPAIIECARRVNAIVIEDNAHGLFGKRDGRWLGTFGALATQSFHETKNVSCGEGGALLINEPSFVERAEILREKGTNRSRFFRGQVDKYTWVDLGSSYLLSDLQAAVLDVQLRSWETIQSRRRALWLRYADELRAWADANGVRLPFVPTTCDQAFHMFYMLLPSLECRTRLIEHYKKHQIMAVFHYLPLHLSPMGLRLGGTAGECPVTEGLSDALLRLPFFYNLADADQTRVIEATLAFTP